jgi:hypothetical protein
MEGLAEVGLSPQYLVTIFMFHVFATIIVGDGAPKGLRIGAKLAGQGTSEASGCLGRELHQVQMPTRSFKDHRESRPTSARDEGIGFPMAGLDPALDLQGTLLDRDTVWNVKHLVAVRMGPESTSLVSSGQKGDKGVLPTGRSIIDKLIDGLMADMEPWIVVRKSSCNGFGRPFELEFLHEIATDQRIPYSLSLDGFMFSFNGSFMGLIGQVDIVDGRPVTFKFS